MKIAWLHPHFLNWMGGHQYILEVAKRLKKKDNYIEIFTSKANSYAKERFKELGIKITEIGYTSTYDFLYWLFLPAFLFFEVKRLKKLTADFNIIISSYFPANIWASKLNKKHYQIMYEPLAFFYDEVFINGLPFPQRIFLMLMKFFYKNLDIQATKRAKRIFTLISPLKERIKKIYHVPNIDYGYEGVDTEFFKPTKNEKIEKKYKGKKIIIHCTDFTKIKGTDLLIKALPFVIKEVPNAFLLITNTLENKLSKGKLINLAKKLGVINHIEFLGCIPFGLLPAYFSRANVLVHTGIGKSGATFSSMPVKQALSCETPVIRSPEGVMEVINGENGYLVNPLDTKRLAERIIKILSNPLMAKRMGQLGRRRMIKLFSWDEVTKRIFFKLKEFYDSSN